MPNVWRLETLEGKGVYDAGVALQFPPTLGDIYYAPHTPSPNTDPDLCKAWNSFRNEGTETRWYFGFSTLKGYTAWFKTKAARRWFAKEWSGVVVLARYKVPKEFYVKGAKQCLFRRDSAVLIDRRAPDHV